MARYIYVLATGRLVSYNQNDNDPVASDQVLAAKGYGQVSGLLPLDATHQWNPATLAVDVVSAQTTHQLSAYAFWMQFTGAELAAIRGSEDTATQRFIFAINAPNPNLLDLNSTPIRNFVNNCASLGLITAGRAAAILSSGN